MHDETPVVQGTRAGAIPSGRTQPGLRGTFPNAKGARSHRLHFHGGLIDIYNEFRLEYDSNYYMPSQLIHPFVMFKDIVELPLYFSDDAPISDAASLPIKNSVIGYHTIRNRLGP